MGRGTGAAVDLQLEFCPCFDLDSATVKTFPLLNFCFENPVLVNLSKILKKKKKKKKTSEGLR